MIYKSRILLYLFIIPTGVNEVINLFLSDEIDINILLKKFAHVQVPCDELKWQRRSKPLTMNGIGQR